jgi:hypothetical protein
MSSCSAFERKDDKNRTFMMRRPESIKKVGRESIPWFIAPVPDGPPNQRPGFSESISSGCSSLGSRVVVAPEDDLFEKELNMTIIESQ